MTAWSRLQSWARDDTSVEKTPQSVTKQYS